MYDDEVKKQLLKINNIKNIEGLDNGKTYQHFESERTAEGDIKMGSGSETTTLKGLGTKFEDPDALPDLTEEQIAKYVGTAADCGQKETSPKHWEACMGLRNLRLQTILQSHAMLKNLAKRREEIVSLIKKTRVFPQGEEQRELGQIQRAQFEIQGQQALMQVDAFQLQVLMDGYKQREEMYLVQQAEARKSMLSRPERTKNAKPPRFNPLIKAAPSNQ
ncbi:MAG: hypothetical protein CVU36_02410 [Betaproteobacteria bacterium HGW-Betaproteobacteria-9]|nr:MAG: hypothetical protein CVU36_02410 [Betaproteobacteria bacterium HGW-Betaproteobacteria-9]